MMNYRLRHAVLTLTRLLGVCAVGVFLVACATPTPTPTPTPNPDVPPVTPSAERTRPATVDAGRAWVQGMSGAEFLGKARNEPQWLMLHLIEDEEILTRTAARTLCIHRNEADRCQAFLMDYAYALLSFRISDDRLLAVLVPDNTDPSADQVLDGLDPLWIEQYRGGLARKIGDIIAARETGEAAEAAANEAMADAMRRFREHK